MASRSKLIITDVMGINHSEQGAKKWLYTRTAGMLPNSFTEGFFPFKIGIYG